MPLEYEWLGGKKNSASRAARRRHSGARRWDPVTPIAYFVIILIRIVGLQPWEFPECNLKPSWVQKGKETQEAGHS